MKIFIDTAEIDQIKQAGSWGILDGVTTNPSLIKQAVQARADIDMQEYIESICNSVDGPVSLEVISLTADKMVNQARELYQKFNPVNDNVVIKIPINSSSSRTEAGDYEGLKALKELSSLGIPTNTTLVMSPEQALLAAKAGTEYVSPFAGRIDDYIRNKIGLIRGEDFSKSEYHDPEWLAESSQLGLNSHYQRLAGEDVDSIYQDERVNQLRDRITDNGIASGVDLVAAIQRIFSNYDFDTEIIAASMRNSRQAREVAELGVDIATLPFQVIQKMVSHYKTAQGIDSFTDDVVPAYEGIFETEQG